MEKLKKWFLINKKADFEAISKKFGISRILARCIINRNVTPENIEKYLHGTKKSMYSPHLLLNANLAANYLHDFIKESKKIRVIGDYDVDGVTATKILITGLRTCGANVDYAIPHRITDGYGLNENLIRAAYDDGVEVIVTCDNGIAAKEQIDVANKLGMKVIVTDHHEVPYIEENGERNYILPNALCVVDPKQEGDTYPQTGICGAVVAYKLIELLYEKFNISNDELDYLLQFAAIATICDVMDIVDENRIIVKAGLDIINTRPCMGIAKLIEATKMSGKTITAGHIGFIIGPCINASGRLETAQKAVNLLEEEDEFTALALATELKDINEARKKMTEDKANEAYQLIEETDLGKDSIFVVNLEDCHESIAGIIAGRIKERYNKPTLVFTKTEHGYKGSGRSIPAYNMFEELNKVRDLFVKFGGHAMAAGMSVANLDSLNRVREVLNQRSTLVEDDFAEVTHIDGELSLEYATLNLAKELSLLEPFGVANATPLFAIRDLQIVKAFEMGSNHNAMKYTVKTPSGATSQLLDFGNIDNFIEHLKNLYGEEVLNEINNGTRNDVFVTITYKISVNVFNGKENVQIVLDNYK